MRESVTSQASAGVAGGLMVSQNSNGMSLNGLDDIASSIASSEHQATQPGDLLL